MHIRSFALAAFAALTLAAPVATSMAQQKPAYKLGERLPQAGAVAKPLSYKEVNWDDLMPADWDPMAPIKKLDLSTLQDSDPRAMEAMEKLRESWNNAPMVHAMNGAGVKIAGFAIPLDKSGDDVRDFLLVPYFGACIHTPPPPSNQVIHVVPDKPIKGLKSMDTLWVSGKMVTTRTDSPWGPAGYQLQAKVVEPYKREKK